MFTEDFESGSNGAVLSTSNTVFDSFYGNDATFTDAHSVTGSLAGDFTANGTQCMASTLTSEPVIYRRFYMWIDAIPTSNSFIAQAVESDSNRAQIRIEPDGSLAVRNAFVKVWTSTAPIPTQEWLRVEWKLDSTNQLQACRLFLGPNLHGTTPNDKSGDVTFDSGAFDQLNIGNVTANTLGLLVDDIEDDNADWPAPAESSPLAVVATAQSTVPTGSLVTLSALASGGGGSYTFA
ncbi:MAG TPA: hypothetical protein VK059_03350, partial [Nocardioidaceae bacterium]|nr:hypothetical protein [Nocardioidaceae bacterium]